MKEEQTPIPPEEQEPVAGEFAEEDAPSAETAETEVVDPSAPAEITQGGLQVLLEKAEKAKEFEDKWLRARAEFDNFRKRAAKEKDQVRDYAKESVLMQLLPVLDSFDMGMTQVENSQDIASIQQGMRLIHGQLRSLLDELGIETIDALGQPFDHNLHEAMSTQETDEHEDGTVISQTRKGYRLKGRLLRPASVVVAKAPEGQ
ncbi:MAG: nucleotide exchange factor GrpE [Verrucomicrobiota bacterium]